MNSIVEDILMHYGMPRRSGRYPYGSGENPYQHSGDFLSRVQELKKSGMSETDIAKNMGLTTTQLRTQMSLAKDERRALQVATAKGLREKGYSLNEIADKMGFANDSSVRSLLNETSENRMNQATHITLHMKKLSHIAIEIIGRCHVLWGLIYHKATISVHSHFYSHCRTDRSASKPETTFPHRL